MDKETITVTFKGDGETYRADMNPAPEDAIENGSFPAVVETAVDRLERQEVPEEVRVETDIDGVPGARPRQMGLIERKFERYAKNTGVDIVYED